MSSKITGSSWPYRYRVETEFDPATGDVFIEYWAGPKSQIVALAAAYKAAGVRVRTTHNGPKWELVTRIGYNTPENGGGVEVPQDQWDLDMEPHQVSIWSDKAVADELALYENPALFRKDIEDAVKDGTALNAGQSGNAVAIALYNSLVRGVETLTKKKAVLTRVRTYSTNYAVRAVIEQTEKIYTTSALVSTFGVPAAVQAQIPNTASLTAVAGLTWGWKCRVDRSTTIPAIGKIQETKDWILDAYSTQFHTLIS